MHTAWLFLNQKRFHPPFDFLAEIEPDLDQLQFGITVARDSWEVEQIAGIWFHNGNAELTALLRDKHRDLKHVSNHAAVSLWFACFYEFGYYYDARLP